MSRPALVPAILVVLAASAAELPLPELKVEATDGGSVFIVRNTGGQPLTAYLIELVGYPGSSFSMWQDEVTGQPIAPGGVKRIPITNMTVGAVPEYVKLQAAVYADGTTSGVPEKVAQMIERRRFRLQTVRELIGRLAKAEAGGKAGAEVITELKEWADSMPQPTRANRMSQASVNIGAARGMIGDSVARIGKGTIAQELKEIRGQESALAASKPALQ